MAAKATDYSFQAQGSPGKRITVLSVDGGGVRGLIPATVLEYLEAELQKLDGPDVRIADYFDIIAGTSTGGLIAGILNLVDPATQRPAKTATDITKFYLDQSKNIFPQKGSGFIASVLTVFSLLAGPKYTATPLQQLLLQNFGEVRLHEAFTDLVVPVFDVKQEKPVFFSKLEAQNNPLLDPLIRQVCQATSAAPTFLPAVYFQTSDPSTGKTQDFNCVDGGLAANNPTFVAISHAIQQMERGHVFHEVSSFQAYSDFLVLSLGTGDKLSPYQAPDVAKWGILSWVYKNGGVPLANMVSAASASIVDYSISTMFAAQQCSDNYLRIQAFDMPGETQSVDDSSAANMAALKKVGTDLLSAQVVSWSVQNGQIVQRPQQGTNAEALTRFATELSAERKARLVQ